MPGEIAYKAPTAAADFEATRNLLGVSAADLRDSRIDTDPFRGVGEMRAKAAIANWQTQIADVAKEPTVRLAVVFATASIIARTFATGGMIGMSNPGGGTARSAADWRQLSDDLWKDYQEIVAIAEKSDTTVEDVSTYALRAHYVAGPHRGPNRTTPRSWSNFG